MGARRQRGRWAGVAAAAIAAAAAAVASAAPARSSSPAPEFRLVQYPAAGFGGIDAQIAHARSSIDMEMYELEDPGIERALVAAVRRGVRVRVLLDSAYHGAEANADAVRALRAGGVPVRLAPTGYVFHIKATTFDGTTADVSTANLTARYYASTRDAEIVDTDPVQVRAIAGTFDHDWAAGGSGRPAAQTVQAPGLIWSPNTGGGTAEAAFVAEIAAAHRSVELTSEELSDRPVIAALVADARRGVACRVVMTRDAEWDPAFDAVTAAGCEVHLFPDDDRALYIHEKLILVDPGTPAESMVLGSQNASDYSLTRNRELSVRLGRADGGAAAIAAAAATFDGDFAAAPPFSAR